VDADAAARAVLADDATAVPKDRGGPVGALRALMLARRSAVKARTQTVNQVHALLVSCDDSLRGTIGRLRGRHLAGACAALSPDDGTALALISLGRRWLTLQQEVATLDREIRKRVKATAPELLARHGVGIHTAAQLLTTAGDNPDRLTHDAAFAALCGTSPVDASSGKTRRHRLNRGGDRSANTALWIIATCVSCMTRAPAPTPPAAPPSVTAAKKSSAAYSATSAESSTPSSPPASPQPLAP
jgi:transposase